MRKETPLRLMTVPLVAMFANAMFANVASAEIAWRDNLRTAHAEAQAEGKQLLLHFYTDNCPWCDKLEEGAFQAEGVHRSIERGYIPVKVHAGRNPKLTQMFEVKKFPTDVVVTIAGEQLSHSVSPQDPERYVAMLEAALPRPANPNAPSESIAAAAQPSPADPSALGAAVGQPAVADDGLPRQIMTSGPTPRGAASTRDNRFALSSGRGGKTAARLASSRRSDGEPAMPTDRASGSESAQANLSDADAAEPIDFGDEEPELAIQGFCPVSVIEEDQWLEGNPEFGVIHLGRLYLFSSEGKMQRFLDDPVPFTPVLNEIDVVRFIEERRIVPGKREWGLKDPVHQRMFFFADEAAMNHFWNKHELYTDAAVQIMDRAVRDANPIER